MAKNTTPSAMNTTTDATLFTPERSVIDAAAAMKMASRCSDYNDSRGEARNFSCREFRGIKFTGEDLSGINTTYSRFEDCEFENCNLSRMEAYFSEWTNCVFKNCSLENANFSFATINDTSFFNCNLDGVDMPFVRGNFGATQCMMTRATAQNSTLQLHLCAVNGQGFEANFARLDIADASNCNFRRSEWNDGVIKGRFEQCDLGNSEFNRSDISELEIIDSATYGMETEESFDMDDDIDSALDEAISELEDVLDE